MGLLTSLKTSDNRAVARIGFWLSEIYNSRHLLFSLVERDFKGKYRNSVLGYIWHALMPVILIVIYLLVFQTIFGRDIEDYWAYLSVGVFSFNFFLQSATAGMNAVIGNKNMVTKMYFPRETLVFATVVNNLITFVISYIILVIVMVVAGVSINAVLLLMVPVLIVIEAVFITGIVFALSAACVYSHDLMYALGRIMPLTMFITPIFYLPDIDNSVLQTILLINPLTYYVECFHDVIYWGTVPDVEYVLVCFLFAILSLMAGFIVFKKLEKGFAERL